MPVNPPTPDRDRGATASSACPICGRDTPHYHSSEEIAEAQRPDGSWRRRRPFHPIDDGGVETYSISTPAYKVEMIRSTDAARLEQWEADMEEWRKNG